MPRVARPSEPPPLRQLGHDLRGLIAAATTNVEYLRTLPNAPAEMEEVAIEIENELRLAADIIELFACPPDDARIIETDLRAFFWLARRSGAGVIVDATNPPFVVRGAAGQLRDLVDRVVRAADEKNPAALLVAEGSVRITGLDPALACTLANLGTKLPLALRIAADGALELVRR